MRIGPKYKIARRLGSRVFEKTQNQKFAQSLARREKAKGRPKTKTDFGIQMLEKQKTRYTYGVMERQFRNYIEAAAGSKSVKPADRLFQLLETRLDNVVYRIGLAKTRLAARQMVSHGHIMVNGRRVTIPSYHLSLKDTVSVRPGSASSKMYEDLDTRAKDIKVPNWVRFDISKRQAEIVGAPVYDPSDGLLDLSAVLEFYSR